jgi:hypothetical protein
MNVKRVLAAATLTLAMAGFSPVVFAQTGAPAGSSVTTSSTATSTSGPLANYNPMAQVAKKTLNSELQARQMEIKLGRQITAARAQGFDVSGAAAQRMAGMAELQHGNRDRAMHHFDLAQRDLDHVYAANGYYANGRRTVR